MISIRYNSVKKNQPELCQDCPLIYILKKWGPNDQILVVIKAYRKSNFFLSLDLSQLHRANNWSMYSLNIHCKPYFSVSSMQSFPCSSLSSNSTCMKNTTMHDHLTSSDITSFDNYQYQEDLESLNNFEKKEF